MSFLRKITGLLFMLGVVSMLAACGGFVGNGGNAKSNKPLSAEAQAKLKGIGSSAGAPMMIRIFKESSELEVWKLAGGGQYVLFDTYEICTWSGDLGPKIKEGDRQSPEGFYTITPGLMNPNSSFYLAFNTGFPNKFDRAHGRTGSNLMVHGDCRSVGCYAMTDAGVEEIYALARETFKGGNKAFQVQIFPFRMTNANMTKHKASPHLDYWRNIKEGYDRFDIAKVPPSWDVCGKQYVFDTGLSSPLDPIAACPALRQDPGMTAQLQSRVASLDAALGNSLTAEAKAAQEKAAIQARGEAISGFFGAIVGKKEPVMVVVDPTLAAPVPAPRS